MKAMFSDREEGRLMAKVAQQAQRYEDMVMYMRGVVKLADAEGTDPSPEERTLLSAAFKGAVNARRTAWHVVVAAIEAAEKETKGEITDEEQLLREGTGDADTRMLSDTDVFSSVTYETQSDSNDQDTEMYEDNIVDAGRIRRGDTQNLQSHGDVLNDLDGPARMQGNPSDVPLKLLARYRKVIECEICLRCRDIVKLLDEHVHAEEPESKAFFLKLKADYLRYIAEVQTGQRRNETAEETLSLYRAAQNIVKDHLPATHYTRLGIALNFSVFYADIMNSFKTALILAKEAVQDAKEKIDKLDENLSKDSALILELIQANIKLWSIIVDDGDKSGDNKSSNYNN